MECEHFDRVKLNGKDEICLTGKVHTSFTKNLGLFDLDEAKNEYKTKLLPVLSTNLTQSVNYYFHIFNPTTSRICQIELTVERLETGEINPKHKVTTIIFSSNRFPPSVLYI